MFFNFVKVAFRHLKKNRLVSFINIGGLALGIVACLLIAHYVKIESSYDSFYKEADQIYRIAWINENPQTRTPHPMAQALVTDFPEVTAAVSLTPIWGPGLTKRSFSIRNPDNNSRFDEKRILAVDSTFFDVFGYSVIAGDGRSALNEPGGLVLTETTSKKYFGNENPIGKRLIFNEGDALEVKAVVKDIPYESHFHFDILVSYLTLKAGNEEDPYFSWSDFGHYNYIKLHGQASALELEDKIPEWIVKGKFINASEEELQAVRNRLIGFDLQPIKDIHLNSHLRWELEPNGNISYVYLMCAAAIFILVIACVNFINLTTARSVERSREIGMRKTLGAMRKHLSLQFLAESLLISFIGLLLAIILVQFVLPYFNQASGLQLSIDEVLSPTSLSYLFLGVSLVGICSGLYPALLLSSFKPTQILRGQFRGTKQGNWLRKSLVVFQFSIAISLILGSIIIFDQLNYLSSKPLGFEQEQIIVIPIQNDNLRGQVETIKEEMLRLSDVLDVSACSNVPGTNYNQHTFWKPEDEPYSLDASECFVDYDFFETMGIELTHGRSFQKDHPTDIQNGFVINEAAAQALQLIEPEGKAMHWDSGSGIRRGNIIGVTKNFHYQSLHEPVRPIIFRLSDHSFNYMLVKTSSEDYPLMLSKLEGVWRDFDHQFDFQYYFLDEQIQAQYISEQRLSKLFSFFTLITAGIACFGLFGLTAYSMSQRTKEVGIRKVLGAGVLNILQLLSSDFMKLVGISIVISLPLGGIVMHYWLQNFAYRIELDWWMFAIAALFSILIALFTISYQSIVTATANPTKSLRSE
ncbi:ABC transporter permease [Porifericola rhodea]|uniref:FtsX-like permease family protein n=1 Tax=Porifericola rhodea TaxID=930972 RepID=UPI0026653EA5|nr:FtsX-like permease family protein [Porifericola rhodea]WKN30880.1 ABC transporter permease [Porifericola rhodea]